MGKRKRRSGLQVSETMEKVLKRYGHHVGGDASVETSASVALGRKQRRRKAKLLKRNKRIHSTMKDSGIVPENVSTKETSNVSSRELVQQDRASKMIRPMSKKTSEYVKKGLKTANDKEDKVISALEKKLYLNKRKGKKKLPKSFVDAGLDYILDIVDGSKGSDVSDDEVEKSCEDAFFSNEINRKKTGLEEEEETKEDNEDYGNVVVEEDPGDQSDENCFTVEKDEDDMEEAIEKPSRILSSSGAKYIPPAMRVKLSDEQEEKMKKLKRRLKGLLNRLSDANMSGICSDIEEMYRESSRAVMHQVLTEAVLEQFCTPDPIPETLISENAMLMVALSSRIGIESLMHFYEVLSLKLNALIQTKDENDGKASNNLLQLLSQLYQFKSIDFKVIFDIFRILIQSFTEKDIELILEILNKIGFQLRKDSPDSLRNIIQDITSKCENLKLEVNEGSRMSYMMNVLMAVKNNNIRKVTGYDPDKVTAKRKKLAQLTRNSDGSSDTTVPPVMLQDFLDIEKNGRWWIVGSSFSGRPMLRERRQDNDNEACEIEESVSRKVADAARMQRMNTDVRRKIFYAIMTADDFVDAFEKVLKCGLKGKQLREIATVVVDCCQQEKSFNPYYLHLLNRFCQHDRQFAISIQCTLWDRFKVLESMRQNQRENIAKLLSKLIVMEDLSLNCLKAINFTEMNKTMTRFLRFFLCTLAKESSGVDHLKTIFAPLRSSSKTKLVRQGLHLFLQYFMLSDEKFLLEHSGLQDHFHAMLSALGRTKSALL